MKPLISVITRGITRKCSRAGLAAAALSATACVASHVLVGKARAPILQDQVQLYLEPPAGEYQEIAIVDASSSYSFALSGEGKAELVISRLKAEAAKVGANGILLQEIADEPLASIGTAVAQSFRAPMEPSTSAWAVQGSCCRNSGAQSRYISSPGHTHGQ